MLISPRSAASSQAAQSSQNPASSAAQSATSISASESTAQSAISITTTDASGHTVTTAPALLTTAVVTTNSNGQVLTVTQIVHNPSAGADTSTGGTGSSTFFQNTGAVAGTFVAVGLVCTAGIMAFVIFMLKRRRRQRLDRDVAAAAAAAAAAATSRSAFDDEDDQPQMAQYGGYYPAITPGIDIHGQPQPSMGGYDYEDPAGGFDPYAANLAAGDRMSTATAPGVAGFGATSAQNTYTGQNPSGYAYDNDPYAAAAPVAEHLADQSQPADGNQYYFDPKQAYDYAAEEDPYGGYDEEEQHPAMGHHRSGSEGSVAREMESRPGLKVTNV
jgi:hypothetical protein